METATERTQFIFAAFLPLAVWTLSLALFYPGNMSGDSIEQWYQMSVWRINDHHPAFHTLFLYLVSRLWPSPAAIALVQILSLVALEVYAYTLLRQAGVNSLARTFFIVAFTFIPVNLVYPVTIWKDVPYGISVFAVTTVLFSIVLRGVASLKAHWLSLTVAIVCTAMFRHNGIVPAMLSLLGLFIWARGARRWVLLISCVVFATIWIIRVPLYRAIPVAAPSEHRHLSLPLHQIAAVIASGGTISQNDLSFLRSLTPDTTWQNYNPYLIDSVVYEPQLVAKLSYEDSKEVRQTRRREVFKLWLRVLRDNPAIVLNSWAQVTSILWRPIMPEDEKAYTYAAHFTLETSNPRFSLSLKAEPIFPLLRSVLQGPIDWSKERPNLWWCWRPALLLYLGAFAVLLAIFIVLRGAGRKRQALGILLISLPAWGNIAGVLITIPSQDVRYAYPSILCSLLFCALPFANQH